jgi:uncharacterized protein (UPF0128 family)
MAKNDDDAVEMPAELGSVKKIAKEYLKRLQEIEDEIETLQEDKKILKNEFKRKLDLPTLEKALKIVKIQSDVKHQDAFDTFMEVLKDAAWQ